MRECRDVEELGYVHTQFCASLQYQCLLSEKVPLTRYLPSCRFPNYLPLSLSLAAFPPSLYTRVTFVNKLTCTAVNHSQYNPRHPHPSNNLHPILPKPKIRTPFPRNPPQTTPQNIKSLRRRRNPHSPFSRTPFQNRPLKRFLSQE